MDPPYSPARQGVLALKRSKQNMNLSYRSLVIRADDSTRRSLSFLYALLTLSK